MSLFHTLLIAADFSEPSELAFHVACALAEERGTRVLVVHALEQMHVAEQANGFGEQGELVLLDEGTPAYHQAVEDHLREAYAPARPLNVDYEVRDGGPTDTLLQAIEESDADLVVMGTHGRTGIRRLLTGSVAEAVLRRAHCSVLALHTTAQPGMTLPIEVILHPVELEAPSESALQTARTLAAQTGARLVLVYVAPMDLSLNGRSVVVVDLDEYQHALDAMRARIDGRDLRHAVEARLERGNVAAEILSAAKETASDLIVMGTHGRSGLGRVLMGSVAEHVLRGATCPVLAVKEAAARPVTAADKRGVSESPSFSSEEQRR